MDIRALDRIITVKPEPQTTPSLAQAITRPKAYATVGDYHFTCTPHMAMGMHGKITVQ